MPQSTFTIPVSSLEAFGRDVRSLGRHAKRLSLADPTFTVLTDTKREMKQDSLTAVSQDGEISETHRSRVVEVVDVVLNTPEMGAASGKYRMVAALQHVGTDDAGKPMAEVFATSVDNAKKAESFRANTFCCEHCKAVRKRNWMILAEEVANGRILQLGNECAKVYIEDPEAALKKLQFQDLLMSFIKVHEGGDERFFNGSIRTLAVADAMEVATHAIASARHAGWTPRRSEDRYGNMTENAASTGLNVAVRLGLKEARTLPLGDRNGAGDYEVTEADAKSAAAAMEWLANAPEEGNDFIAGLKLLYGPGWVSEKKVCYAASIAVAWEKELARRRRLEKPSQHIGEPKKRFNTEVRVVRAPSFDTPFGRKTIYSLEDRDGNVLVWKTTSGGFPGGEGDPERWFAIKGTVKAHGEYRNVKQTELSRVVIERDLVAEKEAELEKQRAVRLEEINNLPEDERGAIAADPASPAFVLERLFRNEPSLAVRQKVAANPSTPPITLGSALRYFDDEPDYRAIQLAAIRNPSAPEAELSRFASSTDPEKAIALAQNPAISWETVETLCLHSDAAVRRQGIIHQRVVDELAISQVERLRKDEDEGVRDAADQVLDSLIKVADDLCNSNDALTVVRRNRVARIILAKQARETAPVERAAPAPALPEALAPRQAQLDLFGCEMVR